MGRAGRAAGRIIRCGFWQGQGRGWAWERLSALGRGRCRIPGRSRRGPRPLARLQHGGRGVRVAPVPPAPRSESSKASVLTHRACSPGMHEQRLTAAPGGTGVTARPASHGRDFIPLSHPRAGRRLPRPLRVTAVALPGGTATRPHPGPAREPHSVSPKESPGTAVGGRTGACSTAMWATPLQNQSGIIPE